MRQVTESVGPPTRTTWTTHAFVRAPTATGVPGDNFHEINHLTGDKVSMVYGAETQVEPLSFFYE